MRFRRVIAAWGTAFTVAAPFAPAAEPSSAPSSRPTTGASADAPGRYKSDRLGVSFSHPPAWGVREPPMEPGAEAAEVVLNVGTGPKASAVLLTLARAEVPLGGANPFRHARGAVGEHRAAAVQNGGTVLAERDAAVDGVPGRVIEFEVPVGARIGSGGLTTRTLVLVAVKDDRAYKLTFFGPQAAYDANRPDVMKLIDSLRWTPAGGN